MIWNLILWIKKKYKQNTCIHEYKIDTRSVLLWFDLKYCTKCDKYTSIN